ncbi:uncharacterized protein Dana_GF21386, isoform B [Drosophila ananassae]|uniref:Uncharacterized protein, isoform B n=1 Tax=Drosophila ananassae TaxID=7217 RepID=B3MS10_DROAN|nr:uncharacterized protein LOC6504070 isoform X2 [Drosophila ananassae]EDV34565.2 uncharacterized protein Dana_GF21386, isoform B [Drosophila ananassae]
MGWLVGLVASGSRLLAMSQHSHSDMEYWQVFFRLYREMPELWMVRSKEYRDRKRRDSAYGRLLEFLQKFDPNANIHTLKRKINNFRTSYRRELRKVLKSHGTYMPSLWYFKEFDFLYELETDEIQTDLERSRVTGLQNQSYTRIHSIKDVKYHPQESIYHYDGNPDEQVQIASDPDDDDLFQDSFPIEEDALGMEGGVSEVDHDPDHEVDPEPDPDPESESGPGKMDNYPNTSSVNIKSSPYSSHHRRIADKSVRIAPRIRRHSSNDSDYGENDAKRGRSEDIPTERERERARERVRDRERDRERERERECENECDLIGKRMAAHFRNMRPDQRLYAERIISEVLVYGRMNRLTMDARFHPGK